MKAIKQNEISRTKISQQACGLSDWRRWWILQSNFAQQKQRYLRQCLRFRQLYFHGFLYTYNVYAVSEE